jgi:hypothetical protein
LKFLSLITKDSIWLISILSQYGKYTSTGYERQTVEIF